MESQTKDNIEDTNADVMVTGDEEGTQDAAALPSEAGDAETGSEAEAEKTKEAEESENETRVEDIKEPADEWTYILGHERLKKKTTKPGKGFETRPTHRQVVTIRVEGKLEDGTVVDKHDELKFSLGDGDLVQALDLSIALMEDEEIATVYTEAAYAYGALGNEPDIPPNANITYEVELLKIEPPPVIPQLSLEERQSIGETKRERGNYHFNRKDYAQAIHSYTRALEFLSLENVSEPSKEQLDELNDIKVKCNNNKAASQLKIEAWDACISSCDEVLKVDKNNVKALFRKGKATASKGELDEAISILRLALENEPKSKIIHQELSILTSRRNKMNTSQRELCKRMFAPDKAPAENKNNKGGWSNGTLAAAVSVVACVAAVGLAMYRSG